MHHCPGGPASLQRDKVGLGCCGRLPVALHGSSRMLLRDQRAGAGTCSCGASAFVATALDTMGWRGQRADAFSLPSSAHRILPVRESRSQR
eukprot:1156677-Pelagomonas_calceolata.AAC.9